MTRYVSVAVVDDPAQLGEDHYCLGDLPVCVPNWFGKHHVEDYMGRTLTDEEWDFAKGAIADALADEISDLVRDYARNYLADELESEK